MGSSYRGANVTGLVERGFLDSLYTKNANIIRYQIVGFTAKPDFTVKEWKAFVRMHLDHVDNVVIPASQGKAEIIIDMHWDAPTKKALTLMWEEIAIRYKNNGNIFGYGILNEPARTNADCNKLMARAAKHIYAVDRHKRVIVSSPYGDPTRFRSLETIKPPPGGSVPVWYEAHMYYPSKLTHQGVYPQYPTPVNYPTVHINKDSLVKVLKPVRDFQLKHKVPIYIGEFGISWFASTATRINYLRDCMNIFEDYGWRYTFFEWEPGGMQPFTMNDNASVAAVVYKKWAKNFF